MSGRIPQPAGFYPYRPASLSSRSTVNNGSNNSRLPPPPPPPPPSSQSPAFAYGYSYDSALVNNTANYQYHGRNTNFGLGTANNSTTTTATASYHQGGFSSNTKQAPTNNSTTTVTTTNNSCWRCDACDLTLETERALKSHRKSHVRCSDCSFEGAPKVVKGHYQAVHGKFSGSGFKTVTVAVPGCRVQRFRICVGNRPEDIQKWIADRKKRFPRQSKPISEQKDGSQPATKNTNNSLDKSHNNNNGKGQDTGISSLLAGYGSSSESEADDAIVTEKKDEITKDSANSTAIAATSPTLNDENTTGVPKSRTNSRPCRYFFRNGKCKNGDQCRFSHDTSSNPQQQFSNNKNDKKRKRGKASSSDTLLRKLLVNDMEREATFAIQLLGYIVDSNFFEQGGGAGNVDDSSTTC